MTFESSSARERGLVGVFNIASLYFSKLCSPVCFALTTLKRCFRIPPGADQGASCCRSAGMLDPAALPLNEIYSETGLVFSWVLVYQLSSCMGKGALGRNPARKQASDSRGVEYAP